MAFRQHGGIFVCMRAEATRKPDIKLLGRFLLRLLAETFRPFPSLSVPFFFSFFRTLWPSWKQSILLRCLVVNPEALLLLYADKVRLCLTEKQFTFLLRFLCLLFRPDTFYLLFRVDFRCPFYLFFPSALLHTSPERALIAMPAGKSEQDRTYRTDIRTFLLWQ